MRLTPAFALAAMIAPLAIAAPAFAVEQPADFVTKAAQSNMFEIKSSQMALKISKNAEVRGFAQMMIKDHTKASKGLESAAHQSHLNPPTALDSDHQGKIDDLAKAGDGFDKAYVDMQADGHKQAVDMFDDYAKNGTDEHLKGFATKTLPVLLKHLDKIKTIKSHF